MYNLKIELYISDVVEYSIIVLSLVLLKRDAWETMHEVSVT